MMRSEGIQQARPEVYSGEDVLGEFHSIGLSLPLSEIYDDILN